MKNAIGKWAREMAPKVTEWKGERAMRREQKLNGHNYILTREDEMTCSAIGRQDHIDVWKDLERVAPHIAVCVRRLPLQTSVMGELFVPGRPATTVPSGLLGHAPLTFAAFALPIWQGVAVPFMAFIEVRGKLLNAEFNLAPEDPWVPSTNWTADLQSMLIEAEQKCIEGFVLKSANYTGWYKVKPVKTADVVVMGWKPHLRHDDQVGAFYIGAHRFIDGNLETIGKVGSGLTKEDRETLRGDECIGRVMEVEYQSIGANGGLEFPVFLRWRDDKPASQCFLPEA